VAEHVEDVYNTGMYIFACVVAGFVSHKNCSLQTPR